MKRNIIDWLVLGLSVLAIAVLVVLLVIDGLDGTRAVDPTVTLHSGEARSGQMGWIVPATVANDGDVAAEVVVIEATAQVAGTTETSEVEINFLPAGTEVEVAFVFSQQPQGEIATRLVSFRIP